MSSTIPYFTSGFTLLSIVYHTFAKSRNHILILPLKYFLVLHSLQRIVILFKPLPLYNKVGKQFPYILSSTKHNK
jgi:hypothetical protein